MNIINNIINYNKNYLSFAESRRNIIIDGQFTKIIYAKDTISIMGLYFNIPVQEINENKDYLDFKNADNYLVKYLIQIEKDILEYYLIYTSYDKHQQKELKYDLYNKINEKQIKVYKKYATKKMDKLIVKISGVWESQTEIGITFKFIEGNSTIVTSSF